MLVEVFLFVVLLLILVYYHLTSQYDYWEKRGVKYLKPHFIFGSYFDLVFFRRTRPEVHQEIYNAGAGEPYIGIIQTRDPALYIRDPEIIRCVLGKHFSYFHDRGLPIDEKSNPLAGSLFTVEGARWRGLRTKLTPSFTSGKMKNMLPLMQECSDEMVALLDEYAKRKEVAEMREILARFTTDVIGTCAFGVQCNSLRNPDAEFRKMGALMFKPSRVGMTFQNIFNTFPELVRYMPTPPAIKKLTEFFLGAIKDTVKYREENNVQRNDFLDLIIEIRKKGSIVADMDELKNDAFIKNTANMKIDDFEFTENLMAAQAFVFFVAGFETSSTGLSYALIEISRNYGIQQKLRKEIDEAYERDGDKLSYDAVMKMPYLDRVVSETLRMYPPVPILLRKVTDSFKMPDSTLVLEKGLKIYIPVHAIHHDPNIYPEPEKFHPERFSDKVKQSRHNYVYLPFGEGPRNCIGQRFGLLQMKLCLAELLRNFEFELGPETPYPPIISASAAFLTAEHGTYLRIRRRSPKARDR